MATNNSWNSNIPVPVSKGGTGATTLTNHGILVGAGSSPVAPLAEATNGQLVIGSTGNAPVLATLTAGTGVSISNGAGSITISSGAASPTTFATDSGSANPALDTITIAGGTNIGTTGAGSTVTVNLDAAISGMTAVDFAAGGRIGTGTSAGNTLLIQAFDVDGAAYTTFATLTANNTPTMDFSDAVTKAGGYIYRAGGTDVPVADGGTGASTFTANSLLLGNGASPISALGAATNGQLPIGSTSASPVLATLTAGTGISVTNGSGSITINSIGNGITWNEITAGSANMAVNNGYIANNVTGVDLLLPAVAAVGDIVTVVGKGSGGWVIRQNDDQIIYLGALNTTTGTTGNVASTLQRDAITLVCVTANDEWSNTAAPQGTLSVT